MSIQEKINYFIETQFSEFFRREGHQLVRFIELYYEWLDSEGQSNYELNALLSNQDIDLTEDRFVQFFKEEFMSNIPAYLKVDERFLVKHIIDFYRSKGSEDSFRFLFRILFDEEIEFYYPAVDILRASDGKWIIDKSILITSNRPFDYLDSRYTIKGSISNATARIDRYNETIENGILKKEIFLNNIIGLFLNGETIYDETGENLGTIISDGIITHSGRFLNNDGCLSMDKYVQDNDYFQEFSYEIRSSKSSHLYKEVVEKTVHPAGTKMFGRVQQSIEDLEDIIEADHELILDLPTIDIVHNTLTEEISEKKMLDSDIDYAKSSNIDYSYLLKTSSSNGYISQSPISVLGGELYTVSLDVYPGNQSVITIKQDGWGDEYFLTFDYSSNSVTNFNNVSYKIEETDDDRKRIYVLFIVPVGMSSFQPKFYPGEYDYSLNSGLSILVRRFQIEKTAYNSKYVETLASSIVNTNTVKNYFLNSNNLNATNWTHANVDTFTVNGGIDPYGAQTAAYVVSSSAGFGGLVSEEVEFINSSPKTISIYYKWKSGPTTGRIQFNNNSMYSSTGPNRFLEFNMQTGTIENNSTEFSIYSFVKLSNGWYRVIFTVLPSSNGTSTVSFQAKFPATGYYIWGPQIEQKDAVSVYVPTGSILRDCMVGSNFIKYSNDLTKSEWIKTNSSVTGSAFIRDVDLLSGWEDLNISIYSNVPLYLLGDKRLLIGKDTKFTREVSVAGLPSKINDYQITLYDKQEEFTETKKIVEVFSDTSILLENPYFLNNSTDLYYKVTKNRFGERYVDYSFEYYPFVLGKINIVNNQVKGTDTKFTEQLMPGDYIILAFSDLMVFMDDGNMSTIMADATNYLKLDQIDAISFKFKILSITDDLNLTLEKDSKLVMDVNETIIYGIENQVIT